MPRKDAIVAAIVRIDPPVARSGAAMFQTTPEGFTITFAGGPTARLLPGDRAAGRLEILEELRRLGTPAYVEVDASGAITQLLVPLVVTVANVAPAPSGDVAVELEISQARHVLRRDHPDFAELLAILNRERESHAPVVVTETDAHEIIDVRPPPVPLPPLPTSPPRPPPHPLLDLLRRLFRFLFWFLRCVSARRAQDLFDLVNAPSCDPLTVPIPCIPFLYPDDGCWGRAHEMCRLMIAVGAKPAKVWIYGDLRVSTRNNPRCHVSWGWHVAPTLCVRKRWFFTERMVIDPALFATPVPKATWKSVQGDVNALLVDSSAAVFRLPSYGPVQYDPAYAQTQQVLAIYRLQLKNRSLQVGPPPYANCP